MRMSLDAERRRGGMGERGLIISVSFIPTQLDPGWPARLSLPHSASFYTRRRKNWNPHCLATLCRGQQEVFFSLFITLFVKV